MCIRSLWNAWNRSLITFFYNVYCTSYGESTYYYILSMQLIINICELHIVLNKPLHWQSALIFKVSFDTCTCKKRTRKFYRWYSKTFVKTTKALFRKNQTNTIQNNVATLTLTLHNPKPIWKSGFKTVTAIF